MSSAAPLAGDRVSDILAAACRVVVREGAHGLRMAGVADEAGVSKALLHYYFATRQELLRAAFAYATEVWDHAVRSELRRAPTGFERVERYLLASVDPGEPFNTHRSMWNEVWSSLRLDSELRPLVRDAYEAWVDRLVSLLDEGRRDGSIAREVSARATGQRLAALADGLDSMLYLGLAEPRRARQLLREGLARELGTA